MLFKTWIKTPEIKGPSLWSGSPEFGLPATGVMVSMVTAGLEAAEEDNPVQLPQRSLHQWKFVHNSFDLVLSGFNDLVLICFVNP